MDLSVIIPAHDATGTLRAQLDALVGQSPAGIEWEVIVVDNRSDDDPAAIVSAYADAAVSVRLVEARDEAGAGHARNVGAAGASGPHLAFCDADDIVADGWVAAMNDAIARDGFVAGALDYERLNPAWAVASRGRIQDGLPLFEGAFPVASSCNLGIDADLFSACGGFDNGFQGAEDAELSLRLWADGRPAAFAPDALVHYRLRTGLGALFRQSRGYARRHRELRSRLAEHGVAGSPRRTAVRSWLWLAASLPSLRSPAGRARWVWVLGQRTGSVSGLRPGMGARS